MDGIGNKLLLILPALLLMVPAGYATDDVSGELMAAYQNMKCKTDFTTDLIDDMVDEVPESAYLSDYSDALDEDMEELESLAEAGDRRAFQAYVQETLRADFADTNDAIRQARNQYQMGNGSGRGHSEGWNVSLEAHQRIRERYSELNEAFQACDLSTMQNMGQHRLRVMEASLERYAERAANLSARGVDTTDMTSAIDDARSSVVEPLRRELNAAGDSAQVRHALRSYCLGDGCRDGVNEHFFAHVELAKLGALLDFLESDAQDEGLGNLVSETRGYLDEAERSLGAIGDSVYGNGQSEGIWGNIQDGSDSLREILRRLRS